MNNSYAAMKKFWSVQGFDESELEPLKEALSVWSAAFPAQVAAQNAAEAARRSKDAARRTLEAEARPVTSFIQGFPKTTDADRATIGITVRDTGGMPVPPPTTRSQTLVRVGGCLTHTLRLSAAPRSKPDKSTWACRAAQGRFGRGSLAHADRCWPPANSPIIASLGNLAALAFLTMATKPMICADFRSGGGGKTAVYMTRWINTRGEKWPWSEIAPATVAA